MSIDLPQSLDVILVRGSSIQSLLHLVPPPLMDYHRIPLHTYTRKARVDPEVIPASALKIMVRLY